MLDRREGRSRNSSKKNAKMQAKTLSCGNVATGVRKENCEERFAPRGVPS